MNCGCETNVWGDSGHSFSLTTASSDSPLLWCFPHLGSFGFPKPPAPRLSSQVPALWGLTLGTASSELRWLFPICSKSHFRKRGGKLGFLIFSLLDVSEAAKTNYWSSAVRNKMYLVTGKVQEHSVSSRMCVEASFTNECIPYTLLYLQISHLLGSIDGKNRDQSNGQAASTILRITSSGTQHFLFIRSSPLPVYSIGSPHILLGSNRLVALQDNLSPMHFLC